MLYKNRLKFNKKTIDIVGFDIMNLNNSYYKDHLYLKLEPISYLNALHKSIISFLDGMIDMFIMNDLKNFVPHISCGKISDSRKIEFLISMEQFILIIGNLYYIHQSKNL